MEEKSVQIFTPYEIPFAEKNNGFWGWPLLPEILGQPPPLEWNCRFSTDNHS